MVMMLRSPSRQYHGGTMVVLKDYMDTARQTLNMISVVTE